MKRFSTAIWSGSGKDGTGLVSSQTKMIDNQPYTFYSRFSDEQGTNPEELLAAAHASDFTMKLSFVLDGEGYTPERLETVSFITIENGAIISSHLVIKILVEGIGESALKKCIKEAECNCLIGRALNILTTSELLMS